MFSAGRDSELNRGGNIKDAPNVKKRKVVKDNSSDDEYSSNYMTGHIVKRLKKYEAKMAALKASKAQKYPVVKPILPQARIKPLIQKKQSWPDLLQPNKSKPSTVRPLDTLQLIKNMGITTLRVGKNKELPVKAIIDKSGEPSTQKNNNDSVKDVRVVTEVPQFKDFN